MLKKTAWLLSFVLLVFGLISTVSAEAAGVQDCKIYIGGKQIPLKAVDANQWNQEISKLINQILAQLNGQAQKQAEQKSINQPQAPAQNGQNKAPVQQKPAQNTSQASLLTADEKKMLDLINQERQQRGLAPLKVNGELVKVARAKAKDMIDNNYFSHYSPTYGSPADMLKKFGISYRIMGENLAGNSSVEGAHRSLMNSAGHRANILNSQFGQVGIGIVNGGPYGKMFVQLFTD